MPPRRITLALPAAVALVAALSTAVAPAASASGGVTLSVSKSTVLVGTHERFSGHAGANQTIELQREAGRSWRSVATHRSSANGSFSFSYVPAGAGHVTFRVSSARGASSDITVAVMAWHYLSDLQTVAQAGYICLGTEAIEINGVNYLHSISFCSESKIGDNYWVEYNLSRKCSTMRATFGVRDDSDAATPVDLSILGDGNQVYSIEAVLGSSTTASVNVAGHLRLRVAAAVASNDPSTHNGVTPAFGDAEILCSF
jgi:hypothetical protein